jgi:hypothetical protein
MRPLWQWRPAWLRRLALAAYLPVAVLLMVARDILCAVFLAALELAAQLARVWPGRDGVGAGWAWCRATWRGEHVGKALLDYFDSRPCCHSGSTKS